MNRTDDFINLPTWAWTRTLYREMGISTQGRHWLEVARFATVNESMLDMLAEPWRGMAYRYRAGKWPWTPEQVEAMTPEMKRTNDYCHWGWKGRYREQRPDAQAAHTLAAAVIHGEGR